MRSGSQQQQWRPQPASGGVRQPDRRNPMARPPPPPEVLRQQQQAAQAQQQAQQQQQQGVPRVAPRPVRPAPPAPQRQDLRPWQVAPPAATPGTSSSGMPRAGPAPSTANAARQAAQRRMLSSSPAAAAAAGQPEGLLRTPPPPSGSGASGSAAAAAAAAAPQGGPPSSHVVQLAARLSAAELRGLCERKGLAISGTKAQLAARLVAHGLGEQP